MSPSDGEGDSAQLFRNSRTFTTESWIQAGVNRSDVRTILETSLYRPVKVFLEGLGLVVKGEVGGCDLVAMKGDDLPVVVICELKLPFNLELILQGVERATASDEVWLAARLSSRGRGRESDAGFATFVEGSVSASPPIPSRRRAPPPARRSHRRRGVAEPIMTAYRQRALACAAALAQGPRRPRDLKSVDPGRSQDSSRECLWLVRPGRARCVRSDRVRPGRAFALAAPGNYWFPNARCSVISLQR